MRSTTSTNQNSDDQYVAVGAGVQVQDCAELEVADYPVRPRRDRIQKVTKGAAAAAAYPAEVGVGGVGIVLAKWRARLGSKMYKVCVAKSRVNVHQWCLSGTKVYPTNIPRMNASATESPHMSVHGPKDKEHVYASLVVSGPPQSW